MTIVNDIVIAQPTDRDKILNDADHSLHFRCLNDVGISVDDVVTLLSLLRSIGADRDKYHALRREVFSSYAEDINDVKRNIGLLATAIRDELARVDESQIAEVLGGWPTSPRPNELCLIRIVTACRDAQTASLAVMFKSYDSFNEFEDAIGELRDAELMRAFDAWDGDKRLEAHEKYKFLKLIGHSQDLKEIREEVESKLHSHCATLAFLRALREMAHETVAAGVGGLSEPVLPLDSQSQAAITKFETELSQDEQKRVLRAFSVALTREIMGVAEDGRGAGVHTGPTSWALVEIDLDGKPTGRWLEASSYFDAGDEFWADIP